MNYKIKWSETHNPNNWDGTLEFDIEPNRQRGIKNILDSYPYIEHWIAADGWLEGTCESTIIAEDVEDAMKKAFDEFECEVFNVYSNDGVLVGNESGIL